MSDFPHRESLPDLLQRIGRPAVHTLAAGRHLSHVVLPIFLMSLFAGCTVGGTSLSTTSGAVPVVREGFADAGDGVQLFYRAVGNGRDTVVVIHGGPGFSMRYFGDDLAPLAKEHTLLFYDQRGTGRSTLVADAEALTGERFAADLEALRRHFALERLTLLGHSWGAGVAALYAERHPERVGRLIIVGGVPAQRKDLIQAFEVLAARRDSGTLRQMQEWREARTANPTDVEACREYYRLWFEPFFGNGATAERKMVDMCGDPPESLRNKIVSVDRYTTASLGDWDWRPALRRVTAPALVIHGTADPLPLASAREWAAVLPNGRLLQLDGIGHFPYREAPDEFFAAVDAFLRGRWPDRAQIVTLP
jgi:proline iminopeptidase